MGSGCILVVMAISIDVQSVFVVPHTELTTAPTAGQKWTEVLTMTNADKIRQMSDEELADWLDLLLWGTNRDVPFAICCTVEKWRDWLQEEVESDG